jgi:hypothetical protein
VQKNRWKGIQERLCQQAQQRQQHADAVTEIKYLLPENLKANISINYILAYISFFNVLSQKNNRCCLGRTTAVSEY